MPGEWEAGVVLETHGEAVPSVENWEPVQVPGRPAQFADADGPVAYRRTFEDERLAHDERTFLEFRGLYARGHIWINGQYRGVHRTHFTPARFEFDADTDNEVVVVCEQPERAHGVYTTGVVPAGFDVPGIWWGVDLNVRPSTFISQLDLTPRIEAERAVIEASATVDAAEGIEDSITFSVRPEGFQGGGTMERAEVSVRPGTRRTVRKELEVRDPEPWQPRERGPQRRYTVRAKLDDDAVERTTGFRVVEFDDGELSVNGRRTRARGLTRLPGEDPTTSVERATAANATLVHVRGHVAPPEFYAACDDAGVLVWQDLPVPAEGEDGETYAELTRRLLGQLGHHPSVAVLSLHEHRADPFASPLGTGFLSKLRFRWRSWRADGDAPPLEAAREVADETTMAVVPTVGPPGTSADASLLAPGWRYLSVDDLDWLLERDPALGAGVGSVECGSVLDPGRRPIPGLNDAVVAARGEAATPEEQAAVLKSVIEGLRRHGCDLLAGPPLQDVASGGGLGLTDVDGSEKPSFDAVTDSLEPVQVVATGRPRVGTGDLELLNDSHERVEATVEWQAGSESGSETVTAGPLERVPAGTATVPEAADELLVETTVAGRTVTNRYRV